MDDKIRELIGIGAAYAADCQACLAYHIRRASQLGIGLDEVKQAIEIGAIVKNAAIHHTDELTDSLLERFESLAA